MTDLAVEPRQLDVRGAAAELFAGPHGEPTVLARYKEVLLEGPRGTGKSFPALVCFHQMCASVPHLRMLFFRQTLRSERASVQTTYETRVLAHETPTLRRLILGSKSRENRTSYDYPNGSQVVLGGLDKPDSWLGADFDVMWGEEARQFSMRSLDTISGNLRNGRLPGGWHGFLLTSNPGKPTSGLNLRFPRGSRTTRGRSGDRVRLLSKHDDNPTITEEYLTRLRLMKGAEYRRLYLGEWCGEEGQVWPEFDDATHVLEMRLEQRGTDWYLVDAGKLADKGRQGEAIRLVWFVASFDYGYRVGCLGVWGFDARGNAYCVAEWYRTHWHRPEWTAAIKEAHADFRPRVVLADAPDGRFLGDLQADISDLATVIQRPDKSAGKERGIQAARMAIAEGHVYFIEERYRLRGGPDPHLVEEGKPTSTTAEMPGYVYPSLDDAPNTRVHGEREKSEVPEKGLPDHGCLVAGTRVATLLGPCPIEAVEPGHLVWTPAGPRPVVWSGRTREAATVYEVQMSDGAFLRGTGDHGVWTARGWVALDSLRYRDTVAQWRTPSSTAAGCGTSAETATTGADRRRGATTSDCRGASTKTASARSRQASTYTTGTGTSSTTRPRISKRSARPITLGSGTRKTLNALEMPRELGTRARPVESGTVGTLSGPGSVGTSSQSVRASSAALSTSRDAAAGCSADPRVERPTEEQVASMAKYADASLVRASSFATDTRRCGLALARVLRVRRLPEPADVYNIEVEGEHVFFANGVLVANCDTLEYLCTWRWGSWRPDLTEPPGPPREPQVGEMAWIKSLPIVGGLA